MDQVWFKSQGWWLFGCYSSPYWNRGTVNRIIFHVIGYSEHIMQISSWIMGCCFFSPTNDFLSFQIANALGLSGVSYDIISTSDLDNRMSQVYSDHFLTIVGLYQYVRSTQKIVSIPKFRDTCSSVKEEYLVPKHSHWWVQSLHPI